MRLVESVAGELLHLVEDFAGNALGMTERRGAAHKAVALPGHFVGILLAHGAAQQIGFAQRVAGEHVGDLHHLLLVNDDAERLLEHRLHLGEHVLHLAAAPLALDEIICHAALNGAGPIERV